MRSLQAQDQLRTLRCTAAFRGEHVVAVTEQALPHRTRLYFLNIFPALSEVILSMSFG